jgi:gamma-glutamyltranspeptidase/glutathione hydrolase
VAGTLSGWDEALRLSAAIGGRLPLARLVEDAAWHAETGFPVTASQAALTAAKHAELKDAPGFEDTFLIDGRLPREGEPMRLPALGRTLRRLGEVGIEDFYRGGLARTVAADLAAAGAPVAASDLAAHRAERRAPLSVRIGGSTLFNLPPPTQGLASLVILALFDRLTVREAEGFDHVHGLVEATKQAFLVRDRILGHPGAMTEDPALFLEPAALDRMAARIDRARALPWPAPPSAGDTVWLGAIDGNGVAVSFIQSIFFEFGSGTVLPETGITWQNRGASFLLDDAGPRRLAPGHKPFHTLNPALAAFDDGRVMVYGTMGGEGQPQTQAALFTRYAPVRPRLAGGRHGAALAPRQDLGREQRDPQGREPLSAGARRGLANGRATTSRSRALHGHHGPCGRDRAPRGRGVGRRDRPAQRRRGAGVLSLTPGLRAALPAVRLPKAPGAAMRRSMARAAERIGSGAARCYRSRARESRPARRHMRETR